jgi:hypothetical protein
MSEVDGAILVGITPFQPAGQISADTSVWFLPHSRRCLSIGTFGLVSAEAYSLNYGSIR